MIAKEQQRTGESAPERASKVETIYDAGRRPIGRQCLLIAESGDDDQLELGADGSNLVNRPILRSLFNALNLRGLHKYCDNSRDSWLK